MTDHPTHPNRFAIGQPVLLYRERARTWSKGVISKVTAFSRDFKIHRTGHVLNERHEVHCDGVYYEINTGAPDSDSSYRYGNMCTCSEVIVPADASERWRDDGTTMIGTRPGLQLFWRDTGGKLAVDSSDTPLDETDIVDLTGCGGERAAVDIHDLIEWAAEGNPGTF